MNYIDWAKILLILHFMIILLFFIYQTIFKKYKEPFEIINWLILMMFLFYVLRPAYMIINGNPLVNSCYFTMAIFIGLLSTISLFIGYYSKIGKILVINVMKNYSSNNKYFNKRNILFIFLLVLFIIFFIFNLDFVRALFGGKTLLSVGLSKGQIRGTSSNFLNSYYWSIVRYILFILYFLMYIQIICKKVKRNFILIFIIVTPLYLFSFVTGTRWGLISQIIILFLLPFYIKKIKIPYWKILAFIIVILFIFSATNIFRTTGDVKKSFYDANFKDAIFGHLNSFDNFVILINALDKKDLPFLLGYPYIYLPINMVPRYLWNSKPIISPCTIYTIELWGESGTLDSNGRIISAQTITAPGEFFWEFHIPGVILGIFLWGLFSKVIKCYCDEQTKRGNIYFYIFYLWFCLQSFNSFRDSFFILIVSSGLFLIAWIFIFYFLLKRVKRKNYIFSN